MKNRRTRKWGTKDWRNVVKRVKDVAESKDETKEGMKRPSGEGIKDVKREKESERVIKRETKGLYDK